MPLAELKNKYRKVSSIEKASKGWQDEYEVSSKQIKLYLIPHNFSIVDKDIVLGGLILPVWKNYRKGSIQAVESVLEDKKRKKKGKEKKEKERALAALMTFVKFDPPIFDGENVDSWIVEMWIDSMETLFEELSTLERDRVPLAVYCLKQSAKAWWQGIRRNRSPSIPPWHGMSFGDWYLLLTSPDSERESFRTSSGSCGNETAQLENTNGNSSYRELYPRYGTCC
uniref:Retrotransposon gag domain-containing protein n=1 Tax=Ananas comosus var. bracteatus TaxID=296719 RepID=A0A6V7NTU2_ANACO|nr:unnamed protein product [Ananas comosus var. bracteatus]